MNDHEGRAALPRSRFSVHSTSSRPRFEDRIVRFRTSHPIGLAIDRQNRLFVVESHTHQPRADYPGPKFDRVKIVSDTDGGGKADSVSIFAENLKWSMNLTFSPAPELYLTHRNGVGVLHDRNHGVSEVRSEITGLSGLLAFLLSLK
ncbi:MAG: hypothetical protein FJ398_13530 [Verrucomicrobia bacterium]|nr:hypothetical protein [Verrucomicrobiota bacterium]